MIHLTQGWECRCDTVYGATEVFKGTLAECYQGIGKLRSELRSRDESTNLDMKWWYQNRPISEKVHRNQMSLYIQSLGVATIMETEPMVEVMVKFTDIN